jgi:hypothetical protein
MSKISEFVASVPFLGLLPQEVLDRIDLRELFLPTGFVQRTRQTLEEELDCYVMTYKLHVFDRELPLTNHLCANLGGAKLYPSQLEALKSAECKLQPYGVSLVAYAKPLKLMGPLQSALFWRKAIEGII